nr:olfactory receptor 51 [Tropidothorax elegans]
MITTDQPLSPLCTVKVQLKLMRLVTMWPFEARSWFSRLLCRLYFACVVGCLWICTVGLITKAAKTDDLVDRSEAIDIFTLTCTGSLKLLYFVYHHDTMKGLVDAIDTSFPISPLFGTRQLSIARWMKWCGPLSVAHCATAFFCISVWGICPLLNVLFGVTTIEKMPLPMNVWYPIDVSSSQPYFVPLYAMHFFGLISSTHVYMSTDGFLFSLIFFSLGQIRLLKLSLRGIEQVEPKDTENEEIAKENALKKCIELHNKIIAFLKELELIFRTMIVFDVLHAIVSLSFAIFQMSESKGILEMSKMVVFITYCFLHQYLNSLLGQTLINEQESLVFEVYQLDWTRKSKSFRKSVQIMMASSVTPVRFSAWRMYFLQYETFLEFCRTMVSIFMVLRTLKYDK